jgi:triacylglycerol lipase
MIELITQIPFVFANPVQTITPLGADPARLELGQLAARMWTSFVADLDPNGHGSEYLSYLTRPIISKLSVDFF